MAKQSHKLDDAHRIRIILTDATSSHRHGIVLQKLNSSDLHKKISGEPKREIVIKRITV